MKRVALLLILLIALAASSQGAYLSRLTGARPLALGNAFTGLAGGSASFFISPAGLAGISSPLFTSMYTQPDTDTLFTALGAAAPLLGGTIGAGYRAQTLSNLWISTSETVNYTNQEIVLSYARAVNDQLAIGGDARFMSKGPSRDYTGSDGVTASGTAFDLSVKYRHSPALTFGIAWQEIAGKLTYRNTAVEEFKPNMVIGAAYRPWTDNRLALDLDMSKEEGGQFLAHLGAEWTPLEQFAFRLGGEQVPGAAATYTSLTAGLGIRLSGVTFDYAYYKQGDPTGRVTHYFSVGYEGKKAEAEARAKAEATAYPTPEPIALPKARRVRFADIPVGHFAKEPAELLATAGLIAPPPDGKFRPDDHMTRMEFSLLWVGVKNVPTADPVSLVGGKAWAKAPDKPVLRKEAAKKMGLTVRIERPNEPLTRGEFAVLLSHSLIGQNALKRLPPVED